MPKEQKGGQYEMVLEGRHLLGVFFAVVLLCAVFFTLGFVLGRDQASGPKTTAAVPAKTSPAAPAQQPAPDDLSFYQRVEGKQPPESLAASQPPQQQAGKAPAEKPVGPGAATRPSAAAATAPIYLQVAAVSNEADAKRLADELWKLGFPAVVRAPAGDRFYRVLAGPFDSSELATAAQRRLEAHGFRDIIRR